MCGIAGIIQSDPRLFNREHLIKMTGSLAHRGPDGEGFWQNSGGKVLLGHRRLAIIDLSDAASQPFFFTPLTGENGKEPRYTIIHNGEIYNYIELRKELQQIGYSFRTASDTEVIAAAYDHYGAECVDYFDGMFAFAIWDEEQQELFAARDRFGEKPFYYCFDERAFVFASEMKALWALGIERRPNLRMLFNFITIGYTDNPSQPGETFFENISRLPAASTLCFKPAAHELIIEKYWDIDPDGQNKSISDDEATEEFSQLFFKSVKRRLRSDVPLGTSLSGGLDSSAVVSMASHVISLSLPENYRVIPLHPPTLASFTAIFPGYDKDESAFASQVADQFQLRAHTIEITANDLMNDWEKFLYHQEEPFASASAFAQFKVFDLAKQHQVKVLLDGQGADETLAGYNRYYKWYWQELFQKRKLIKSRELRAAREMGIEERFTFKNVVASLLPDIASVILERQYLVNALRHEDLTREFIQLQSKEAYYSTPANFNLNGALYFNTCTHGLEELLRLADRNSMAHGREVRLPFLSHELVEYIFSLPSHLKIHKAWTKWILRLSMIDQLPNEIVWRKNKVGFEPPQAAWMKDKRVQDMIYEGKKMLVNEKILREEVLYRPIKSADAHEAGNYDWRYLTAAICLKK